MGQDNSDKKDQNNKKLPGEPKDPTVPSRGANFKEGPILDLFDALQTAGKSGKTPPTNIIIETENTPSLSARIQDLLFNPTFLLVSSAVISFGGLSWVVLHHFLTSESKTPAAVKTIAETPEYRDQTPLSPKKELPRANPPPKRPAAAIATPRPFTAHPAGAASETEKKPEPIHNEESPWQRENIDDPIDAPPINAHPKAKTLPARPSEDFFFDNDVNAQPSDADEPDDEGDALEEMQN